MIQQGAHQIALVGPAGKGKASVPVTRPAQLHRQRRNAPQGDGLDHVALCFAQRVGRMTLTPLSEMSLVSQDNRNPVSHSKWPRMRQAILRMTRRFDGWAAVWVMGRIIGPTGKKSP